VKAPVSEPVLVVEGRHHYLRLFVIREEYLGVGLNLVSIHHVDLRRSGREIGRGEGLAVGTRF